MNRLGQVLASPDTMPEAASPRQPEHYDPFADPAYLRRALADMTALALGSSDVDGEDVFRVLQGAIR